MDHLSAGVECDSISNLSVNKTKYRLCVATGQGRTFLAPWCGVPRTPSETVLRRLLHQPRGYGGMGLGRVGRIGFEPGRPHTRCHSRTGATAVATLAYVQEHNPAWWMIENVRAMSYKEAGTGKSNLSLFVAHANSLGYRVAARLTDASQYGLPQRRCTGIQGAPTPRLNALCDPTPSPSFRTLLRSSRTGCGGTRGGRRGCGALGILVPRGGNGFTC